ncbi:hypothetical protein [Streptomyces sp. TLI_171]|uniref:hypothetical protein n=1 Tax=Streptomyces sp. TLI_171 TaxID=1938859 RepID=UPI000C6BAA62|nr:hypothetical protein [Streptomyces sp. TLI_171]RKE22579.1 hypothetical protein BX266_6025 [Streptomyces sp. TLI_171]
MLNSAWRAAICVLTGIGLALTAAPASADGPIITPCAELSICTGAHVPGSTATPGTGGTGGGGGASTCSWNGETVPCWRDDLGWFSEGCYYRVADPQPLPGEPVWDGHTSADGTVYDRACLGNEGQGPVFLTTPPPAPPRRSPRAIATDLLLRIDTGKPVLHAAPQGDAVVGSPVWLWFDRNSDVTGPLSEKVTEQGVTVITTITLKSVTWQVDDAPTGSQERSFSCDGPGAPFQAGGTPTCSHVFTRSSAQRPDHAYSMSVRLNWQVTARLDNGTAIDMTGIDWTTSPGTVLRVPVNEVQVLN